MKTSKLLFVSIAIPLMIGACDHTKKTAGLDSKQEAAALQDVPILPVTKGDYWRYKVQLEIPADVTSPGAPEGKSSYARTRTYLGKVSPAGGLPEVDCFEVTAPNAPTEREFVEIYKDGILMRGSMIMRPETTKPMWLERPIPFVMAGMKAGTELPEFKTVGGGLSRKTQVVAREDVTVPAGTFPAIRILMTGHDGEFELRRTTWFSPGIGVVQEEKTRYLKDKLIFHETHQLVETTVTRK